MIDYEFIENKIKFINTTDKEIVLKVVGIINGTNIALNNYDFFKIKVNGWFIPHIDYRGLSSVEVYIDNNYHYRIVLPSFMSTYNKYRPKIVCIGLNKSGTTSFKDSLKQCGLKPFNEVFGHQYLLADIEHRNIHSTLSLLEYPRYDFYEDMPFSLLNVYKNLYIHRPQDYYVLTLRDTTEQWVESAYRYYVNSLDTINLNKDNKPYDIFYHGRGIPNRTRNYLTAQMRNWGINSNVNLKENLKDVYNRHVDDVFDYFDNKIDSNFISINVSKENELKKLSNFVGFETKENNFVWSNKSKK